MTAHDVRKILAFGTGVGLEIGDRDLRVVVVRIRPSGVSVLGSTAISDFRGRPATEWGAEYSEFLRGAGAGHVAAFALLPRREVIVRHVNLPGVADRDLGAAIEYQIDALHPYGEGEAQYSWARLNGTATVLVGITRRSAIERYHEMLGNAGIKLAALTFSAAALYSGSRLFGAPPADGFLAFAGQDGEMELYGESPSRPIFSAVMDVSPEKAAPLAAAELRLAPDAVPMSLRQLLPEPKLTPADHDVSHWSLPYAAALAAACPRLALPVNLLPPELRSTSSRAMFVPTAALATVLVGLVAALAAQARLQERRHLEAVQAEIAKLEPRASRVAAAESDTGKLRARIRLLDAFRQRTASDLDSIKEITGLLAPPAWLSSLELTRDSLSLAGEIEQAAPLLKTLDGSPRFRGSEFTVPILRTAKVEVFRIRASREETAP
jgi:hypothetical protein